MHRPGLATRKIAWISYGLSAMLAGITFPLALMLDGHVLEGRGILTVIWPIAAAVSIGIGLITLGRRFGLASGALVVGVGSAVWLTLWPYLIRPALTLNDALASPASQYAVAGAVGLVIIIGLPCLYQIHRIISDASSRPR